MNKAKLKTYAPQARKDFIAAVEARANLLGLSEKNGMLDITASEKKGEVAVIAGQAWPAKVHEQRQRLIKRMKKDGFAQTVEAVAYTWFNRFAALRFMEIHDYLGHGHRVLSSREGGLPEIIAHATEVAGSLPGINAPQVADMKLAGNKDSELYRLLLVAQCNALSGALPFLFERIDDESELLLPDNLIRTDSLIRSLVEEIPEADWAEIEIIGWIYQFYISEKKDQVIGKVVASEDIPAATQLFTPNWIVKYMVQNALGAQWLATYPDSPLKAQMAYYIQPAEQPAEAKAQLAAITPGTLDPEDLTLIDPACGSGHILVEAYELFKAIYLERGYRQRDVAQLILEKNLYGLDIDERAAQLTGFALMMKGRADDRRLLERGVKLNVMALVDSAGFDAEDLAKGVVLGEYGLKPEDLTELKLLFEHATTFGSLIQVPEGLAKKLPALKELSEWGSQDLFVAEAIKRLGPLVQQADLLAAQYDAVVANPPYMGSGGMNTTVKKFAKDNFSNAKSDLFACFIERGYGLSKEVGHNSMVTMESWMFLSGYESFRNSVLRQHTLRNLAHFPYDGKQPTAMGINFGIAVVSAQNTPILGYRGHYCCSRYFELRDDGVPREFPTANERLNTVSSTEFAKIPGSPVAYWVSDAVRLGFESGDSLGSYFDTRLGMSTANNDGFVRDWCEVAHGSIHFDAESREDALTERRRWFPYQKGGPFRKWYGNNWLVVDWENDGARIRSFGAETGKVRSHNYNLDYIFRRGITWTDVTSARNAFRWMEEGYLFDGRGSSGFSSASLPTELILAFLNTELCFQLLRIINPTLTVNVNEIQKLPVTSSAQKLATDVSRNAKRCLKHARVDWDSYERSWDFEFLPILTASSDSASTLESSYTAWITQNRATIAEMKCLEEENNRLFIDAYGLADELTPDVPIEQITLTVNPPYRYGGKLSKEEQWTRFRQDTMAELVSYAIGCMMGRYSLDEPGLIYAHAGNIGFAPERYKKFSADTDGIVPITDEIWFEDDTTNRVREFVNAVWGLETLDENMRWLADSLGRKGNETPDETLRRYVSGSFYKDHLQTYKRRPIYWQFSSGKQGAFQALVYLHRYHEGTLARLRAEYVVPLTGKMQSRIEMLEKDRDSAGSTATRTKIAKQIESLKKKHAELLAYDEKLRHYADMRIQLDLDDGVKVNYGKFGDLLAEVKAVTGGAGDD